MNLSRLQFYIGYVLILLSAGALLMCPFVQSFRLSLIENPLTEWKLQKYADGVVATCKNVPYRPGCYDREIPKLMDDGVSMEDAFLITAKVQSKDPAYVYCHVLGHNISAKEAAKDPSSWDKVIARCPTGMCANGCLHGAVQQRFQDEVLTEKEIAQLLPDLASACTPGVGKNYTPLEEAICYHGLGHLGVYATGGNLSRALALCSALGTIATDGEGGSIARMRCLEGAFMHVFQFLDAEDKALVQDISPTSSQEAEAFCLGFTGEEQAVCHRESWPLNWNLVKTPLGLTEFCSYSSNPRYTQDCYNVLFNVILAAFHYDQATMTALCEQLPAGRMAQCFAHAASHYIDSNQDLVQEAASMCAVAADHGVGDRCYSELLFFSVYSFHEKTPEFYRFCNALPQPWRGKCLRGDGHQISAHTLDI